MGRGWYGERKGSGSGWVDSGEGQGELVGRGRGKVGRDVWCRHIPELVIGQLGQFASNTWRLEGSEVSHTMKQMLEMPVFTGLVFSMCKYP